MGNRLIPLYRERELYTLFYNQHKNKIYKLQHRNKSFAVFFFTILVLTWASESLDIFYQAYQSTFLNVIILIIAIGITYFVMIQFYRSYYQKDTKREMIMDKHKLQECVIKGLKQLRIEFYISIISLPIGILFLILFFVTGESRPLAIGCVCLGVIFILILMRPIERKKVLKRFR